MKERSRLCQRPKRYSSQQGSCRGPQMSTPLTGTTAETSAVVQPKPLRSTAMPEKDEPVRMTRAASSSMKKSMNALWAVLLGFVENDVCASPADTPRSTNPATVFRSSASAEQLRAMLLLHRPAGSQGRWGITKKARA